VCKQARSKPAKGLLERFGGPGEACIDTFFPISESAMVGAVWNELTAGCAPSLRTAIIDFRLRVQSKSNFVG